MKYLHWNEQTITDFSDKAISDAYNAGYVFTRLGKGKMQQTRSIRIDLSKFKLSSENRRILKKVSEVSIHDTHLPLPADSYDFKIGKLAKDFYDKKFGPGIMSAQKIKEMLTDVEKSNFNLVLTYAKPQNIVSGGPARLDWSEHEEFSSRKISVPPETMFYGFAISYTNKDILHYSYPFYDLNAPKDTGLGMMTLAIQYAQEKGLKYIYLGSLQRPNDTYKLQFSGIEWFNGSSWSTDLEEVKKLLSNIV